MWCFNKIQKIAFVFVLLAVGIYGQSSSSPDPITAMEISLQGRFDKAVVAVGDSVHFEIQVQWLDKAIPIHILSPDSVEFFGLGKISETTHHLKKVQEDGTVRNQTSFVYTLKALNIGSGRVSSLKITYFTSLDPNPNTLALSSSFIDIKPASTKFVQSGWFQSVLLLFILLGLTYGFVQLKKKVKKKAPKVDSFSQIKLKVKELKTRLGVAESKAVLLEMQQIAFLWLESQNLVAKGAATNSPNVYIDNALSTLLKNAEANVIAEWKELSEAFEHARFAGGNKEVHELSELLRILKRRLNINWDEEET